jgi:collagenase-like PrtC family protease
VKKLSVPYAKDNRILDFLTEDHLPFISEVYLPLPHDIMASGRSYTLEENENYRRLFEKQIERMHGMGLRVNVLAARPVLDIHDGIQSMLRAVVELKRLREKHGVEKVTIGNFAFLLMYGPVLKDAGYEIELSVLADVNSTEKVEFIMRGYPFVGSICLYNNMMNRRCEMRALKDQFPALKLKILVNHACLYNCPSHVQHHTIYSNLLYENPSPALEKEWDREINIKQLVPASKFCQHFSAAFPVSLLRDTAFIRPEDLHLYDDCLDIFKLSGREHPSEKLMNAVRAYCSRRYEGNLVDILDIPLKYTAAIDNTRFPEYYGERKADCRHECRSCNVCVQVEKAAASPR